MIHPAGMLFPLGAVVLAAAAMTVLVRSVRPRAAAVVAGSGLVAGAMVTTWLLVGLGAPWLAGLLHAQSILVWCDHLYHPHTHVPSGVAMAAAVLLAVGVARAVLVLRRRRAFVRRARQPGAAMLEIVTDGRPRGFALPGRPGRIVITTGLLDALDPTERQALVAHELAHLEQRHYAFLLVGDLAVAVAPFLAPLRGQLRFALERWADETAGHDVGDRTVVARAIARAALVSTAEQPAYALGVSSSGVPARVEALLAPADHPKLHLTALAVVLAGSSVTAAMLQFHHIAAVVRHLC